MTGYALRNEIRDTLGHFWSESFGQIYPTLAALEDAGLVRPTDSGRRSRTVYEITPDGVDRLRDLLAEPHQPAPARNGLLLRLFFGNHLAEGSAADLLTDAGDIEIVGESGSAQEATRRIPALRPDVAILDGRLPDGSGIDITARNCGPGCENIRLDWRDGTTTLEVTVPESDYAVGARLSVEWPPAPTDLSS